jgi:beta-xylosidase
LSSLSCRAAFSQERSDSTYCNPIIYADYSDPDVVRIGGDYYMTSSSFSHFPGLPILHSNDLVHWTIVGHAILRYPMVSFNVPQKGNGVWAPSIRYQNNEFYIHYGDPDHGVFLIKAKNPSGPWEPLTLVHQAKGWIDPCPFWDDDGNAYLVHAWAKSRAGFNSILTINKMSPDGRHLLDDGITIFDGHANHLTIEGPKLYKRNGYYYIFAPAGGVKQGWQTVLRSKNIYGPYEDKIVLRQGTTDVNGPHQGAWVETPSDESWFVHFQDRGAYGRIVHLQPMRWSGDWPLIGEQHDSNGVGEPVKCYKKPDIGKSYPVTSIQTSDEFNQSTLGFQWQWESNPESTWYSFTARKGWLRLYSQAYTDTIKNLWEAGSIVGQKFPAHEFVVTVKSDGSRLHVGEFAGLTILGVDYAYIGIEKVKANLRIVYRSCLKAEQGAREKEIAAANIGVSTVYLRVTVKPEARCSFSYSVNGRIFSPIGSEFTAKPGKWVGAKVGLFAIAPKSSMKQGFADFDWFRID